MSFFQPPVPSLPKGIDLSGKTVIVTGATAGIGLEITRQLLHYNAANIIMAVRNTSKGEHVRQALLAELEAKSTRTNAVIKVMELDTENYESIQRFVLRFTKRFSELHILLANAGVGTPKREFASSNHEMNLQVNYLSNVRLTLALLPTLEATANKLGETTRVTWTGSRMFQHHTLSGPAAASTESQSVLSRIDNSTTDSMIGRYADSKLLCLLFQLELAKHYKPDKVIINSFCPGLVNTGMLDALPFYMRIPMKAVNAVRARSPEKAAWIALNAAICAGPETHGRLLCDMEIDESSGPSMSKELSQYQVMIWNETIREMRKMADLPMWMIEQV